MRVTIDTPLGNKNPKHSASSLISVHKAPRQAERFLTGLHINNKPKDDPVHLVFRQEDFRGAVVSST